MGLPVARVDQERRQQLAERIVRTTMRRVGTGEFPANARIVRVEPCRLVKRFDRPRQIAFYLRESSYADQEGGAPEKDTGKRGLILAPCAPDARFGFIALPAREMRERGLPALFPASANYLFE
jgi:hypothetical protein